MKVAINIPGVIEQLSTVNGKYLDGLYSYDEAQDHAADIIRAAYTPQADDLTNSITTMDTNTKIVSRRFTMREAAIKLDGYKEPLKKILNRAELETYSCELLKDEANEKFYAICVDAQCRVIANVPISTGSLSEVSAYPRKVVAAAILTNAHSVFLAHNHPGGTCAPSTEDITSTLSLQKALNMIGVMVLDHMIVTPNGSTYSMAQNGDIDFRARR